jgi:hypothetical protein
VDPLDITLNTIGQIIGTVGFPSLVAIILLQSLLGNFNKRLDNLDEQLAQLNKTLVMIVKVLNEKNKDFEFDETLAQNHVFCPKTSNAHKVLQRFTVTSSNGGTDDKSKDS